MLPACTAPSVVRRILKEADPLLEGVLNNSEKSPTFPRCRVVYLRFRVEFQNKFFKGDGRAFQPLDLCSL